MSTDAIFVRELAVNCVIGVHAWERASRQPLLISVTLQSNIQRAAATDDIRATTDYAGVAEGVTRIAVEGRFHLVETLAERIAGWILATFDTSRVCVEVQKPAALAQARSVGVSITRHTTRPGHGGEPA
jgi:dihydroneopterin aldolase